MNAHRPCRLKAALALFALVVLATASLPVCAQQWGAQARYVNITEAKVEQLSNAVRITLKADGLLEADVDFRQFWSFIRGTGWTQAERKRFTMSLLNARSQVGRFVDVGVYPVSHVSLSVPPDALEGVGLEATLALYVPARIGRLQGGDSVLDWTWRIGRDDRLVDMVLSDNQRELILTVFSDFHHEVDAPPEERARAEWELAVEPAAEGCRLWALRAPLQAVMDEISAVGGVAISLGPDVDRRLTANLPAMPAPELLAVIARIACLNLTLHQGTYYLSEGAAVDVASYWGADSRRIRLANLSVDDAVLLIPTFLLKHIQTDPETNTLVAYGPPDLLAKLEADLRELDNPPQQIRVRAMVIELRDAASRPRALSALLEGGTTATEFVPSEGRLRMRVVDQPLDRLETRLRRLEDREHVRMDARPEMVVLSGREASLFVGRTQYYRFLRQRWWGQQLELRSVDIGIRITTTPWTGDGHTFTTPFSVSADSIISRDAEGLPLVSRQSADGALRVTAGQTIIFGGLRLLEASREERNIHPLHEAPVIGGLLQAADRTETTSEVWVCLGVDAAPSPHEIVTPDS